MSTCMQPSDEAAAAEARRATARIFYQLAARGRPQQQASGVPAAALTPEALAVRFVASTLSGGVGERARALLGVEPLDIAPDIDVAAAWFGLWAGARWGEAATLGGRRLVVIDRPAGLAAPSAAPGSTPSTTAGLVLLEAPLLNATLEAIGTTAAFAGNTKKRTAVLGAPHVVAVPSCLLPNMGLALAHLGHLDAQAQNRAFELLQLRATPTQVGSLRSLVAAIKPATSGNEAALGAEWALVLRAQRFAVARARPVLTEPVSGAAAAPRSVGSTQHRGSRSFAYEDGAEAPQSEADRDAPATPALRALWQQRYIVPKPLPPPPAASEPDDTGAESGSESGGSDDEGGGGWTERGGSQRFSVDLDESEIMPVVAVRTAAAPNSVVATPPPADATFAAPDGATGPGTAAQRHAVSHTGRRLVFSDDDDATDAGGAAAGELRVAPVTAAQLEALRASAELRAFARALRLDGADVRTLVRLYLLAHHTDDGADYEAAFRRHAPAKLHSHARRVREYAHAHAPSAATRGALLELCRNVQALPAGPRGDGGGGGDEGGGGAAGEVQRFVRALAPHGVVPAGGDAGEALRRYAVFYATPDLAAWREHYGEARPSAARALAAYRERHPRMGAAARDVLLQLVPAPAAGAPIVAF